VSARTIHIPECISVSVIKLANGGTISLDHDTGAVTIAPWSSDQPGAIVAMSDGELVLDRAAPKFQEICELLAAHLQHGGADTAPERPGPAIVTKPDVTRSLQEFAAK
jgi:hypothetical protein